MKKLKTPKFKISSEDQQKMRRRADRQLRLEQGNFIRTGPHLTEKDKKRNNTVKHYQEEEE